MEAIFLLGVGIVFYHYVGYPLVLTLFAPLVRASRQVDDGYEPMVSVLVAAYNEERVIEEKLANFGQLRYPEEKVELLIGSDGSTDGTNELLAKYADQRIRPFLMPSRRGKASVLNRLVREARGEILIFSDANTIHNPYAIQRLVRHFADPRVGGVCGRLCLLSPSGSTGSEGEALYWNYESYIKRLEGKIGSVLGANGAIYALRKNLYSPLPENKVIMDDFLIPLKAIERRYRVVYEEEALATETVAPQLMGEFQRKVRIGAANFNAIPEIAPLLNPLRGFPAFGLWSHKLLRWFIPFVLPVVLIVNFFLLSQTFYQVTLGLQGVFYAAALVGLGLDRIGRLGRPFLIPLSFVTANLGLFVGFFKFLTGSQKPAWARIERDQVTDAEKP